MSKQTEALKLALEYATEALNLHDSCYNRHPATEAERNIIVEDLNIIREALADHFPDATKMIEQPTVKQSLTVQPAQQQKPVAWQERQAKRMREGVVTEWTNWYPCRYRTIEEARAEACDHIPYEWRPLYTSPPAAQQQEPVGEVEQIEIDDDGQASAWFKLHDYVELGQMLYTSPPIEATPLASQSRSDVKPWVGLTDEEVINVMPDDDTPISLGEAFSKFADLIEAKLREKNEHREKNAQPSKPLTDEMEKQKNRHLSPHRQSAFRDGWRSAEAAHGIKENA